MQFYRDHLDKKGWFQVHKRDKNSQKAVDTDKMPYLLMLQNIVILLVWL